MEKTGYSEWGVHAVLDCGGCDIEKISNKISLELEMSGEKEIPTRKIGTLIMEELAKIDHVAYIRFASVYKDFSSAADFAKFIKLIR